MTKRKSSRNWYAVAAILKKAGPMSHRNTPRGGNQNEADKILQQAGDEWGLDMEDGSETYIHEGCVKVISIADDYGDNSATIKCQLGKNHEGPHEERFERKGGIVVINWDDESSD